MRIWPILPVCVRRVTRSTRPIGRWAVPHSLLATEDPRQPAKVLLDLPLKANEVLLDLFLDTDDVLLDLLLNTDEILHDLLLQLLLRRLNARRHPVLDEDEIRLELFEGRLRGLARVVRQREVGELTPDLVECGVDLRIVLLVEHRLREYTVAPP